MLSIEMIPASTVTLDDAAALPQQPPAQVALLDLNAPEAIVDWMLAHASRFEYRGVNP